MRTSLPLRLFCFISCLTVVIPTGLAQYDAKYDHNNDGVIDALDLLEFQQHWHAMKAADLLIDLGGGVTMEMVRIPAGSFQMGADDSWAYSDEQPVHEVTISKDFYMGQTEITQAQWLAVMGTNPAQYYGVGDNYPVYYVSWDDCQNFITALNQLGQGTFRLPSEAEWEYACRAGTTTRFYFGDSDGCGTLCEDCAAGVLPGNRTDYMWYCGNNGSYGSVDYGSKEVGLLEPNGFGLYDMHGNVFE